MAAAKDIEGNPTGFLSLPREIRDHIYHDALQLQSKSKPPECPEKAGPRWEVYTAQAWGYYFPLELSPPGSYQGLTTCNRQIRIEAQELVTRNACLDIMIENYRTERTQVRVWPTWTLHPDYIKHIRELQVEIRLFKQFRFHRKFGGAPYDFITTALMGILNRFFHHGPDFICKTPLKPEIHVDTLTIRLSGGVDQLSRDVADILPFLCKSISKLADSGIFSGRISSINILAGSDYAELSPNLLVNQTRSKESVEYWEGKGIKWGFGPANEVQKRSHVKHSSLGRTMVVSTGD